MVRPSSKPVGGLMQNSPDFKEIRAIQKIQGSKSKNSGIL
jgi:hypothetical protein